MMEDTGLPRAVKTILVRKQQAEQWAKQQSRQAVLERIRKWLNGFNKLQVTLGVACKNRFMMMKQDVWYDYKTGLLLPQLDTFICPNYKLKEFVQNRTKILASEGMTFSNFTGRLITRKECREIFQQTVNYPYRDGEHNRLLIKSAKGTMLARALIDDELFMGVYTCDTYHIPAGTAHALSLEYVGTLIPVYSLTRVHDRVTLPGMRGLLAALDKAKLQLDETTVKGFAEVMAPGNSTLFGYLAYDSTIQQYTLDEASLWSDLAKESCRAALDGVSLKDLLDEGVNHEAYCPMAGVQEALLRCDTKRANISPYPARILTDINAGHWELFEQRVSPGADQVSLKLSEKLIARPPRLDIHDGGVCAIDFGTKSTVVACYDTDTRLLRVGKGDYRKAPALTDYENPTVMELRDADGFLKAYQEMPGRPHTEWEQMTVSHQALARLLEDESRSSYQTVFSELKQWVNESHTQRRLLDGKGKEILLKSYAELSTEDFDPIEFYAYYLGLYINNMANGIYLEYILSFPVNYEQAVCERLRQSFERGIKKSLPASVFSDSDAGEDFQVYLGVSEPAAYAACAIKAYMKAQQISLEADGAIFYGVFDFGGGTTDFDFGIWRLPTAEDKGDWNGIIEHFGAGGDVNLGGEKILASLAYAVYQNNLPFMRKNSIPFALPPEGRAFAGAELLLNDSPAAHLNVRRLSEALRPLWERLPGYEKLGEKAMAITLFSEKESMAASLRVDVKKLQQMVENRIRRGIENFFVKLYHAAKGRKPARVHVFLAGNSSQSAVVQELFQEYISRQTKEWQQEYLREEGTEKDFSKIFLLHQPLGMEATAARCKEGYDHVLTGKTGVAFGLLDCRRGGNDIKVVDHNRTEQAEAAFRYYLGHKDRQDHFCVRIGMGVGYQEWAPFLETDDNRFELYYTSEPCALDGQLPIREVCKKKCRLHYLAGVAGGTIYLRKAAPACIEYTVATETGIKEGTYLAQVERCELL